MSEYQYYEFLALDRPLTGKQRAELRSISTRAEITATRFVNEYQWGDFKGDPQMMMERYFGAFLYLANWGTRQVMLRLPRGVLDLETAAQYCGTETASLTETDSHLILRLYVDREPDDDWDEPGGQLAAMIQARSELAAGDLRLLYLAWLLALQCDEVDDEDTEPPVPAGLGKLSASHSRRLRAGRRPSCGRRPIIAGPGGRRPPNSAGARPSPAGPQLRRPPTPSTSTSSPPGRRRPGSGRRS